MNYKDLGEFIEKLKKENQLVTITTEVDAILEVTEITDRVSKQNGKALLFTNVKNSNYPILINAVGSYERMAMSLGVDDIDEIATDIMDFMDFSNYSSWASRFKALPKLAPLPFIFPHKINNAPCQQVVEEPDLDSIPILKCWPQDGGPFITLPLVITKDPETGEQNMGMYRLQKYDKKTTGLHMHIHKDGNEIYNKYKKLGYDKMPVSVCIGCDPATVYSATAPLPKMIDELLFAGFLRKKAVDIVKCVTNDLYVPAHSEFVLEGYVNIGETRVEGPFGDHTGYYSLQGEYPVFHITKVTRKKEPIYHATIVGQPPMEDCYIGKATERIFLPLLKVQVPEVVDINFPLEGVFHNCVIVSIKKSYPKQAFKVINSFWGMGQMMYTKMIIVVDEDIDVHNMSIVMWKVFNNIDAKRDILIQEGPLDDLDHASNTIRFGNKMGIDATKKWTSEGHTRDWPDDIVMTSDIKDIVTKKWGEYGIDNN